MTDFLPQDHEAPAGGQYFKPKPGENKVRIIAKPIIGWLDWDKSGDKSVPLRYRKKDKPQTVKSPDGKLKYFWALVVYDYAESKIKVWEITQLGIQNTIEGLAANEDWGNPLDYDLKILKEGQGMDTKYSVTPVPPKPLSEEIQILSSKTAVYLDALYDNNDPFEAEPFT